MRCESDAARGRGTNPFLATPGRFDLRHQLALFAEESWFLSPGGAHGMDRQNRLQSLLQFQDLLEHPPFHHSPALALFAALPAPAAVAPAGDLDLHKAQRPPAAA